jgi:hypothetical protein
LHVQSALDLIEIRTFGNRIHRVISSGHAVKILLPPAFLGLNFKISLEQENG